LLADWPRVARRVRQASHVALFLDFDGTLVPLRRRPEDVWLDDLARSLLRRLASRSGITLWLISGRRRADLRRRARVRGARFLGLHGWERDDRPRFAARGVSLLRAARALIESQLAGLSGVWVEDKGYSLAVHYRGAPDGTGRKVRALTHGVLKGLTPSVQLVPGKKVLEVLSREVEGKGAAVRAVVAKLSKPALPIYVGDDTTDEAAFVAIPRGISVRVGRPRQTRACFFLRNPKEVMLFLRRLEAELP